MLNISLLSLLATLLCQGVVLMIKVLSMGPLDLGCVENIPIVITRRSTMTRSIINC